jgi:hypothetical protein
MLPPWLVTFPISSTALIFWDMLLLLAVMTSKLTMICLTLDSVVYRDFVTVM